MTAIDNALAKVPGLPKLLEDEASRQLSIYMWKWFDARQDRPIITKKIWFFSVPFFWRDIEFAWAEAFGPRPA